MGLNRREFMGSVTGSALGAAALPWLVGLPVARGADQPPAASSPKRAAKNLVFMVADGMSYGALALGDAVLQMRDNRRLHWVGLMGREGVRRGLIDTRSANGLVTDSAAASTAWGIGELVDNGKIGMTPDGRFPTPILMQAKQAGKATGLVTTTRVTHATPAGFACNIPTNREDEDRIGAQMLERQIDLIMGGGAKHFPLALMQKHGGYQHVIDRAGFDAFASGESAAGPLLATLSKSHIPFEIDRRTLKLPIPSLAEMSAAALRRMERVGAENGFVLQIEGGRVDHGGHHNDAAGLIYDMIAFDEALGTVLNWLGKRDDTLLIVTTDHATANPGLTEYGARGVKGLLKALEFRHSFEWLDTTLQKASGGKYGLAAPEPSEDGGPMAAAQGGTGQGVAEFDPEPLHAAVKEATGIALSRAELGVLTRWKKGEMVDGFALGSAQYGPLGSVLANHTCIAFLSPNHTSDPVEFTAIGPGAEMVPGWSGLPEAHGLMVKALDLPPAKPV
ncbi:MAG: alkaline phosphatase [Phycisphaerales bacterium]